MKLVIIYGPPAVGKLTVAQALAEATGLKLLHNHLVSDLVLSVFDRNTPNAINLNASIKELIFETAAKKKQKGIVTTFLYDINKRNQIDRWCRSCCKITRKYRGEIFFVRLSCDVETLKLRVASSSRMGTKKITSVEKLLRVIKDEGSFGEVSKDIAESLHIENTDISPEKVAQMIKSHYDI